ncbi:hypothetical protein M9Y10_015387 [Tritrichomonas musculus]|uniref:Uncharacterized protein n=1 Tax=Tritrichomonas musculus TaxID=1915356 RepID=A0ABR2L298_9EUKA
MKHGEKDLVMLYIKDCGSSWIPVTSQTQRIRDTTNQKIRELGNKYYLTKFLFEKLNIKRDDLYAFGKKLEDDFKDIKNGLHLKNQCKRMKELLYCWFAEHFFEDIFKKDSILLQQFVDLSKNTNNIKEIQKFRTQDHLRNEIQIEEFIGKKIENNRMLNYDGLSFNQEIDSFDMSNVYSINEDSSNKNESPSNPNFDYAKYLE